MSLFISTHNACFRAELLKLKRTGLLWIGLVSALLVPLLSTAGGFFMSHFGILNAWDAHLKNCITGYTGFFYPLFLVLLMLRLVYMEHKSDTWKLLETQPVSRAALFLVKFEVALLMAAASLLLVFLFALGGGFLLQSLRAELAFQKSAIPWASVSGMLLRFWIASFGLLAVQYYFSLLARSFALPMTLGLIGIIAGNILASFHILPWFPWSAIAYTSSSYGGALKDQWLLPQEWLSLAWALLALLMGYQLLTQRRFVRAHLQGLRGGLTLAGIALFAFLSVALLRPRLSSPYSSTVIAGKVQMPKMPRLVALVSNPFGDTLATTTLVGGRFHLPVTRPLATGFYELHAGQQRLRIFFGKNDSLYVALKVTKVESDIDFGGTRAAENEFLAKNEENPFAYLMRWSGQAPPPQFGSDVLEVLEEGEQKAGRYRTMNNIGVRPDFVDAYRRLLTIAAFRLTEIEYPRTFGLANPGDTLRFPEKLEKIRRSVSYNDPSLLNVPGYLNYLFDYLRAKAGSRGNRDSLFEAQSRRLLRQSEVRDAITYTAAIRRLPRQADTNSRRLLVAFAAAQLNDEQHRQRLFREWTRLNSVMPGMLAPAFTAHTSTEAAYTLDRLRGRYVVIDVGATWCAPCREESPYFEELAASLNDDRVVFAALSVDDDKEAWKQEAKFKAPQVLQLHLPDNEAFSKAYSVTSIPRFLLIGPDGKIINADMPRPSEPAFAAILQREVPGLGN